MEKFRKYGRPPFKVAVIHGGPGGAGQLKPLAIELSRVIGVLEPLQTAASIEGQVQELYDVLESNAKHPITLIGHSWGAMLSVLFAAKYPEIAKKLILVSCGPLKSTYTSSDVMQNRLNRMTTEQKVELETAFKKLDDPDFKDKNAVFSQLGQLAGKIDSYDPISEEPVEAQYDIFKSVWSEAESLRSQGGFENAVKSIRCPVTVIHGDYDPHPAEGIKPLLSSALKEFQFISLEKCGHYPWIERCAKDKFYSILKDELVYKYTVDQCNVEKKDLLKTYRDIRIKWLEWFDYDKHSIRKQLIQMSWDYALFHTINELRKIALEKPKPNIGFNGSVSRLFDSGFVTTQVFFIRRLVDKRSDVISLGRLIDDMKNNASHITRENYICNDGLPYDADKLEMEWLIKKSKEHEPQADWLDTEGPNAWATSKMLHNEFDALSGISKDSRNRQDVIKESWFEQLIERLKTCEDIKLYSHKYMAHTADNVSRSKLSEEQEKITLEKIDKCHKAIYQVSLCIGRILGKGTMVSPIPVPQYNHLQYLDKQWADDEMMKKAFEAWDEREKEVAKWTNDLWPDIDDDE